MPCINIDECAFGSTASASVPALHALTAHLNLSLALKWASSATLLASAIPVGVCVHSVLLSYSNTMLIGIVLEGSDGAALKEGAMVVVGAFFFFFFFFLNWIYCRTHKLPTDTLRGRMGPLHRVPSSRLGSRYPQGVPSYSTPTSVSGLREWQCLACNGGLPKARPCKDSEKEGVRGRR